LIREEKVVLGFLLSIVVMWIVYLFFPQTYDFFSFYAPVVMVLADIVVEKRGWHHSEETKRKISERLKGRQFWLGKHHTPESRMKISSSQKGRVSPMKGKKLTLAHKLKISIANSLALRGNKSRLGHHHTLEARKKIGKGTRAWWQKWKIEEVESTKAILQKDYDLPLDQNFIPLSLREHIFAREVLINKSKWYPWIEDTGLREVPYPQLKFNGDKYRLPEEVLNSL